VTRGNHTKADHQVAFETWVETHNWTTTAQKSNAAYETPRRWAKADYRCEFGCAWHGWDRLEKEKNQAHAAQAALVQSGNFDPVAHDMAIRAVLTGGDFSPSHQEAIRKTVRTDLERAAQWEFIYAKAFFLATGQVIQWHTFQEGSLPTGVEESMQDALRGGLSPSSFEQCVKTMKICEEQINQIRGKPKVREEEDEEGDKKITVSDLRALRAKLSNAPLPPPTKLLSGDSAVG